MFAGLFHDQIINRSLAHQASCIATLLFLNPLSSMHACMRACVRACVRVCACACMCACVHAYLKKW